MAKVQETSKKKAYDFAEVEPRIQKFWEDKKIFATNFAKKITYTIDTPPPTVSGAMHIGHSFSYSQQDFIARFRRMNGGVFYPFGTDDNGLPTEKLVEKITKVNSKKMSREEFIKLCLKTIKKILPDFIEDWKRLGISADYLNMYSTIDTDSRKASQKNFLGLLKKGHVYQDSFPAIWCPSCQTGVAQADLEDKDFKSKFLTLKFRVKETSEKLAIATTRPELLGACQAVFIHPKDSRAKKLKGKHAVVPIFGTIVPILEDATADPEKGTGILMVCSYGDKHDVAAFQKHRLKEKVVFEKDGTLNIKPYSGLKVTDARKKITEDLRESDLVIEEKDIMHAVNVHDRCSTEIEFLPTSQWFIRVLDKKKELLDIARKIEWKPDFMRKRYETWVKGLEWDWIISRNRHFGIPIPVWKCHGCDEIIPANTNELPVDPTQTKKECSKCGKKADPETLVLDTWATSSITPTIASNLFGGKIKTPYSLRPQGHDIIRTWAFYTIVQSALNENQIPWENIMISGMVTRKGEKMSKSKGNGVDPKVVMDEYGSDALRFWASTSKLGSDLDYQEQDLIAGKKTVTKLWNASKFVFMNLEDYDGKKPKKLERIDERLLIELNRVILTTTHRFEDYEYSRARFNTEDFFWKIFCDYYLEIVKKRIYNEKGDKKKSAQYTLYRCLLTILKMFAPIIPFVTEEIYQEYFRKNEKTKSIHLMEWPKYDKKLGGWDDKSIKSHANELTLIQDLVSQIRSEKTKAKKPMNAECIVTLDKTNYEDLKNVMEDFMGVTNAREVKQGTFKVEFPN